MAITAQQLEVAQVGTRSGDVVDLVARLAALSADSPVSLDDLSSDLGGETPSAIVVPSSGDMRESDAQGFLYVRKSPSAIGPSALEVADPVRHLTTEIGAIDALSPGNDEASAVGARDDSDSAASVPLALKHRPSLGVGL